MGWAFRTPTPAPIPHGAKRPSLERWASVSGARSLTRVPANYPDRNRANQSLRQRPGPGHSAHVDDCRHGYAGVHSPSSPPTPGHHEQTAYPPVGRTPQKRPWNIRKFWPSLLALGNWNPCHPRRHDRQSRAAPEGQSRGPLRRGPPHCRPRPQPDVHGRHLHPDPQFPSRRRHHQRLHAQRGSPPLRGGRGRELRLRRPAGAGEKKSYARSQRFQQGPGHDKGTGAGMPASGNRHGP